MKNISRIVIFAITCLFAHESTAQNAPSWFEQIPQKTGYLYASAKAESADQSMAHKKARTIALGELTKNYIGKMDDFAKTCDTIVGDNNIRKITSALKTEHQARLVNIEEVDKVIDNSDNRTVCYLLIRIEIKEDIKQLKKAISEDKVLKKKSNKDRLSEELDKL